MAGISDEVRDLLDQHPWEDTIPRLELYALKRIRSLYWQGIRNGPMPGGREAEDIVKQAIDKVLENTRRWDPTKHPDLYLYLVSVVSSDINHLAESWANRRMQSVSVLQSRETDAQNDTDYLDNIHSEVDLPDQSLLRKEKELLAEQFFWEFYESLNQEPLLQAILECVFDDVEKRADFAVRLNLTCPRNLYHLL